MRIQPDRLRPNLRIEFLIYACVISVLLFTLHVRAQAPDKDKTKPKRETPSNIQATVEVGAQVVDRVGSHDAKFQETRDVPAGFFIQRFKVDFNHANSRYFLKAKGFEILQDDQRFTVELGRFGKYRTQFVWDEIPHEF